MHPESVQDCLALLRFHLACPSLPLVVKPDSITQELVEACVLTPQGFFNPNLEALTLLLASSGLADCIPPEAGGNLLAMLAKWESEDVEALKSILREAVANKKAQQKKAQQVEVPSPLACAGESILNFSAYFLVAVGCLHRSIEGTEVQTSFLRTLQDKVGLRWNCLTEDLSTLLGLIENPFDSIKVTGARAVETSLTEMMLDSMARQIQSVPACEDFENFTPDQEWLAPAVRARDGFVWKLNRDLLSSAMFMSLPVNDPLRMRWILGNEAFSNNNPVLSHSIALSLVIDESQLPARKAWHTMKQGFHPALPAKLVLKKGSHPYLELRIIHGKKNDAAFQVFSSNVKTEESKSDVLSIRFGPNNIPKSIRLSFPIGSILDRHSLMLGWSAIRCWIHLLHEVHTAKEAGLFLRRFRYPQKTEKYGIEDPFQRMLVAKYEKNIDWNGARITSARALDDHVKQTMLPKLKEKIGGDGANYCTRIRDLHRLLEHGGENLAETRNVLEREGEDAAAAHLLARINARKREAFEKWWKYLSSDNPISRDNAAFQYLILRPVVDSSKAGTYCPPMPLNAEAVAGLFSAIRDEKILPNQDLLKVYQRLVAEGGASVAGETQGARWLVFKNLPGNVTRLAALAKGSGWCIADEYYARFYLQKSTFHILMVNGRPRAALRVEDIEYVSECQGEHNRDPGEDYWPYIVFYADVRLWSFADDDFYPSRRDELENQRSAIPRMISSLDVQQFADKLRVTPYLAHFASPEQLNDPNCSEILRLAWSKIISEYPAAAALAPVEFGLNEKLKQQYDSKLYDIDQQGGWGRNRRGG